MQHTGTWFHRDLHWGPYCDGGLDAKMVRPRATKQTKPTEPGTSTTSDKIDNIRTDLGRINLTWGWIAPTTGEPTTPTGDNREVTKETEDAEMTDRAGGVPTGGPPATGTTTNTGGAPEAMKRCTCTTRTGRSTRAEGRPARQGGRHWEGQGGVIRLLHVQGIYR